MEKKFKKIKIGEIVPSGYNPRKINDKDYEKLKNSLNEFGLVAPIEINLKTKRIIGGHQRFNVLYNENPDKELNLIELGDIGWVFDDTNLKIKDDAHEKALNLALNRISGEFDIEKLNPLLEELEELDLGELTGFDLDLEEIPYDIEVVYSDDEGDNNEEEDVVEDNYEFDSSDEYDNREGQENRQAVNYGEIYKIKNNIILLKNTSDDDSIDDFIGFKEENIYINSENLNLIGKEKYEMNYYTTTDRKFMKSLIDKYGKINVDRLR